MRVELVHPLGLVTRRSTDGGHPLARADFGKSFDFGDTCFVPHISISVGTPRFGKTEDAIQEGRESAAANNCAQVYFSPQPFDQGRKAGMYLYADGHGDRIVFDSLMLTDRVLSLDCCCKSTAADPATAILEDKINGSALMEQIFRVRNQRPEDHVQNREGAELAYAAWAAQARAMNPSWMIGAVNPFDERHNAIVQHCKVWETRQKIASIPKNWQLVRREFGGTIRILDQTIGHPVITMREGQNCFALKAALRNKCILIFEGCPDRLAVRTYFGAMRIRINQCIREHFAEMGEMLPVEVREDECSNYDSIGDYESRNGLETIKMGYSGRYVSHDGFFTDEQTTKRVWQGATRLKFFHCSDDSIAEFCAEKALARLYSPEAVGWVERRKRQVHDGFDEIPSWDTSDSIGKSGSGDDERITTTTSTRQGNRMVGRYREEIDEIPHMLDRNGQLAMIVKKLTNPNVMLPGVHLNIGQTISFKRSRKLEDPCGIPKIAEDGFNEFLRNLKQKDIYQDAKVGLIMGNGSMLSSNGSAKTLPPSEKSSAQERSPLSRLRDARSNGSSKTNGSK